MRGLQVLKDIFSSEWATTVVVAPFLLFPLISPPLTVVALIVLAFSHLFHLKRHGEPWPTTPLNLSLLLLLLATGISSLVTPEPQLTIPKVAGIILGMATFRSISLVVRRGRQVGPVLAAYLLLALAAMLVGLAGTRWGYRKVAFLTDMAMRIPHLALRLPELPQGRINPNQLATVPLFSLPLLLALLIGQKSASASLFPARSRWAPTILVLSAVIGAGVLVFTQSRSAWMGAAAATLFLICAIVVPTDIPRRGAVVWGAWMLTCLAGAGVLEIAGLSATRVFSPNPQLGIALPGRQEAWQHALWLIQDFPLTGTGPGAFRSLAPDLYPFLFFRPHQFIGDAHQTFLQVGVDIGILGLVGYLSLFLTALFMGTRMISSHDHIMRTLGGGITATMVGIHVYGMFNALSLGAKPALFLWFLLAILAGTFPGPTHSSKNCMGSGDTHVTSAGVPSLRRGHLVPRVGVAQRWASVLILGTLLLLGLRGNTIRPALARLTMLTSPERPLQMNQPPEERYRTTLETFHGPISTLITLSENENIQPLGRREPLQAAYIVLYDFRLGRTLSDAQHDVVLSYIDANIDRALASHVLDLYFVWKPRLQRRQKIALLEVLTRHAPQHRKAHLELVRLYAEQGRWHNVETEARYVLNLPLRGKEAPLRLPAYRLLVLALIRSSRLDQADQTLHQMRQTSCGLPPSYQQRCTSLITSLSHSLANAQTQLARKTLRRAKQAFASANWTHAITYSQNVIAMEIPTRDRIVQLWAYDILIRALLRTGQYERAEQALQRMEQAFDNSQGKTKATFERLRERLGKRMKHRQQ